MKKYNIDTLTMAQISAKQLDKDLLNELESRASYIDADKDLNETIVSVDVVLNISTEAEGRGHNHLMKLADELYKQVKEFNYIQIAKI